MFVIPLILAAGSLPLISGLPVPSFLSDIVEKPSVTPFLLERASTYSVYSGNGEATSGWPTMSEWVPSFDAMFNNNKPILQSSCAQWGVPDNTDDEIKALSASIQSVASSTGIDARFILAIIMQESNGCVRAPTTNYGVRNPGLMQSHNGAGSCNDGSVQNPCPASEITQMITDGAAGTSSGDGLKQCLAESGASDVSKYYKAARIYNSGSVAASGNLGGGIATACYATDIANRLTGWFSGPSACDPATIASLAGTPTEVSPDPEPSSGGGGGGAAPTTTKAQPPPVQTTTPAVVVTTAQATIAPPTITPTPAPKPDPTTSATATTSTAAAASPPLSSSSPADPQPSDPSSSKSSSTGGASPSTDAQVYPGATAACQEWYTVQPGDYCIIVEQKFGISLDQLTSWNTGLDAACSNLWLAYQYCVKA